MKTKKIIKSVNESINDFDRSINRLKAVQKGKQIGESPWDKYAEFLEELEEYRALVKPEYVVDETAEIFKELDRTDDISETALNRLADRVFTTIRSKYVGQKTEDLTGGIGVDDVGRDAGLLVPLGGGGQAPLVSTEYQDAGIPKAISAEDKAKVEAAIAVLNELGFADIANQIAAALQGLEAV
jgi:hypothetical protein